MLNLCSYCMPTGFKSRRPVKVVSMIGSDIGELDVAVSNQIDELVDIYGKPVTVQQMGEGSRFGVKIACYAVSNEPLQIDSASVVGGVPIWRNGGYEEIVGDLQAGGLESCTPAYWEYKDNTFDDNGVIKLTEDKRTGNYAVSVKSSGIPKTGSTSSRVYIQQDAINLENTGKYLLTASFKIKQGNPVPYTFFYITDGSSYVTKQHTGVGTEGYVTVQQEYILTKLPEGNTVLRIGLGILSGEGEVVIDDVSLVYAGDE